MRQAATALVFVLAAEGLMACEDLQFTVNGNVEDWYDNGGRRFNCAWYAAGNNRCARYGHRFENVYVANEACCTCGGGSTGNLPDYLSAINTREEFESMAARSSVPGAIGILQVKFVIMDINTANPSLYFMNTNRHEFHWYFVSRALGRYVNDNRGFNSDSYFFDERKNLAGSILAHDSYTSSGPTGEAGLYTVEFWPTDPVSPDLVIQTYQLVQAHFGEASGRLAHFPASDTQLTIYNDNREAYAAASVPVVLADDLFASVTFSPLNLGVGYGVLRVIETGSETFSIRDVVIFKAIPNDLSHVGGIITDGPQTPLSHINLKAKQNNMPNAFIKDASTRPEITALLGKVVRYTVTADGYELVEATRADAEAWLESVRPATPQTPEGDLGPKDPARLTRIGHADWVRYGAKAANVAELGTVLPRTEVRAGGAVGQVPDGYAVPFSMYEAYMTAKRCEGVEVDDETGAEVPDGKLRKLCDAPEGKSFKDLIVEIMAQPEFEIPEERESMLKAFRKEMRKGEVPADMVAKLAAVHDFWRNADGTMTRSVRLRSSTNNEDLEGFNGAGLYESTTHDPDEGDLAESARKVWAGLWTFRAFEERDFYRIDHFKTYMGILCHESYGDEQVNGVGVTKNIFQPTGTGHYVNAQYGEISVTNPEPIVVGGETVNSVPDEFMMAEVVGGNGNEWITQYIRRSNVETVYGKPVPTPDALTEAEVTELREAMETIQAHFRPIYNGDATFAMDIEFKITHTADGSRGHLEIKQARPWID